MHFAASMSCTDAQFRRSYVFLIETHKYSSSPNPTSAATIADMVATIAHLRPPVRLTDKDLEIAETACRANAARCRRKGAIEKPTTGSG